MHVYGNVIYKKDLATTLYNCMSSVLADHITTAYLIDAHTLYFEAELPEKHTPRQFNDVLTGQLISPKDKIKLPTKVGFLQHFTPKEILEAQATLVTLDSQIIN